MVSYVLILTIGEGSDVSNVILDCHKDMQDTPTVVPVERLLTNKLTPQTCKILVCCD